MFLSIGSVDSPWLLLSMLSGIGLAQLQPLGPPLGLNLRPLPQHANLLNSPSKPSGLWLTSAFLPPPWLPNLLVTWHLSRTLGVTVPLSPITGYVLYGSLRKNEFTISPREQGSVEFSSSSCYVTCWHAFIFNATIKWSPVILHLTLVL